MDGVVGGPDSALIVIGCVFLYQHGMLCGYGVQVSVAIGAAVFLVLVKCIPGAFKLHELGLGGQVSGLTVAAQTVVPYKSQLLAGAHLIDHAADALHQLAAQSCVISPGVCKRQSRQIVAGAVPLEFGVG